MLLIGIGSSSLLSQQIIVDSLLKFKKYKYNNKNKKSDIANSNLEKNNKDIVSSDISENNELKKNNLLEIKYNDNNYIINDDSDSNNFITESNIINNQISNEINSEEKNEIDIDINSGDINKNEEAHKFDSFFVICLITILGFFPRYSTNFFLNQYLSKKIYNGNRL